MKPIHQTPKMSMPSPEMARLENLRFARVLQHICTPPEERGPLDNGLAWFTACCHGAWPDTRAKLMEAKMRRPRRASGASP